MAKLEIPVVVDISGIESLIDEIKHLQTYKLSSEDEQILVDRDDVVKIFADHVRANIEPERKTGRWIPCSERLPELDEDGYSDKVLVCFSNFTGCEVCEYRECDDCHGWYIGDSDDNPEDVGVHVIAWMPLPECYREKER